MDSSYELKETSESMPGGAQDMPLSCPIDCKILKWEFECQECQATFEVDVPKGPKEERAIRCSHCGSNRIKRINIADLGASACGG